MLEDDPGVPPDTDDTAAYAELYGLTFPLLADAEGQLLECLEYSGAIPRLIVIGRDMNILISDYPHEDGEFNYDYITRFL
jgi:peroxiredoxin